MEIENIRRQEQNNCKYYPLLIRKHFKIPPYNISCTKNNILCMWNTPNCMRKKRMSGYRDPKFPPNTEVGITAWRAMSVN